jgi:hypothetical protein
VFGDQRSGPTIYVVTIDILSKSYFIRSRIFSRANGRWHSQDFLSFTKLIDEAHSLAHHVVCVPEINPNKHETSLLPRLSSGAKNIEMAMMPTLSDDI